METLLLKAISVFFQLLTYLIFIRILLSWVPSINQSSIGAMFYSLTEPILGPIRHMINNSPIGGGMMLDFSPIIALFLMNILSRVLSYLVMMIF
ncbi:MAG: YggT family protein [Anaerotignaceae bacterium]